MKHKIAPSLLAADFLNLQREVEMINESDADWLHLDIMEVCSFLIYRLVFRFWKR